MGRIVHQIGAIFVIGALFMLAGCATPAQPERKIPHSLFLRKHINPSPLRGTIFISKIGGGEKTNILLPPKVSSKDLEASIRASLQKNGFLSPTNAQALFHLEMFLIELKQPVKGFTITVDSFIRYKLTRKRDRKVAYDGIVTASYKATFKDSFFGPRRIRIANKGSIRANISAFIAILRTRKISGVTTP